MRKVNYCVIEPYNRSDLSMTGKHKIKSLLGVWRSFWALFVFVVIYSLLPRYVLPPGRMYVYPRSFSVTSKPLNLTSGSSSSLSCLGFFCNRRLSMVPLYWSFSFSLCVDSEFLNRRSAFTSRYSKGLKASDALGPVTFSHWKCFFLFRGNKDVQTFWLSFGPWMGSA